MILQLAGCIMLLFMQSNALLAENGLNPKTHNGTKSIFNKEFILPKK